MNYFHSEKYVWVLPKRTGSRALGQLLNFWVGKRYCGGQNPIQEIGRRKNIKGDFIQFYSHDWDFKYEDARNYTFCLMVRNPYARMLSYYKSIFLRKNCKNKECKYTFKEFVETSMIENKHIWHLEYENIFNKTKIDHIIHLENIEEELMQVPMIQNKYIESKEFREEWDRVIKNNIFDKESKNNHTKISEEDAKIIYNCFPKQFELFGYSKDSWLYL
jgi:hypothetical protein